MTPSGRYRNLDDLETLRLLARNLGEGIYISDDRGMILDANPAFLSIFGVQSVAELGRFHTADLYVDPARREEWLSLLERDGTVREFEWELLRPDGLHRTVLDTSYLVTDPESGARYYHGILVDITRRKEMETQLREQLTRDALTG